jgi:hypothetical protein
MAERPPVPILSNPDVNEGPKILGAVSAVTALAFIIVLQRFYVRIFMVHNAGWDVSVSDPLCFLRLLPTILTACLE